MCLTFPQRRGDWGAYERMAAALAPRTASPRSQVAPWTCSSPRALGCSGSSNGWRQGAGIPPGVSGLWAAANLEPWPPALEVRTPPSGGPSPPHDSSSRFSWSRRSSLTQPCGEALTHHGGVLPDYCPLTGKSQVITSPTPSRFHPVGTEAGVPGTSAHWKEGPWPSPFESCECDMHFARTKTDR